MKRVYSFMSNDSKYSGTIEVSAPDGREDHEILGAIFAVIHGMGMITVVDGDEQQ